jgi:hypothetical protein
MDFKKKIDGVWRQTEKGKNFSIAFENGQFYQLKWRLEALFL